MAKKRKGVMFSFQLIATEPSTNKITIEPDPNGPNFGYWDGGKGELTFHKTKIWQMKAEDHHYIEFRLDDRTKRNLRFPSNPKNAMWVIDNTTHCPTENDACNYTVVKPLIVVAGDTLLAINLNRLNGQQFGFTLNFVIDKNSETDASKYVQWDPIINNRDGGS